jgi:hypothetical protein
LTLQGRDAEGRLLTEAVHILFPDYLFARTALATIARRAGQVARASELLAPLFSRRQFHISEFNALCAALIEFSFLTQQNRSARLWFDTWSKPDPDNPKTGFLPGTAAESWRVTAGATCFYGGLYKFAQDLASQSSKRIS